MAPAEGRSWGGLGGDDVSSDLQASMYHKERSRLQVLLDLSSLHLCIHLITHHPCIYTSIQSADDVFNHALFLS